MAKYYYSRYYASYQAGTPIYTTEHYYVEGGWVTGTSSTVNWYGSGPSITSNSYSFNEITGFTTTSGTSIQLNIGGSVTTYSGSGASLTSLTQTRSAKSGSTEYDSTISQQYSSKTATWTERQVQTGTSPGYYYQGSFIDTIIAEDGTYPLNGQSGSYWYVRGAKASNLSVNIGGTWRDAEPYVNVNGVWKSAESYTNINGVWKQ